eukprot:NP_509366.2 Uncharacterized protein CELE_K07E3.1 [Caenorhabditis elegans]
MSDRPPDEPGFAYFWRWLAREKVDEELYRLIRTTPGLPDQSWMVEDVEKTVRDFMSSRVDHLKSLLEGWEIMEKGMNKEIATQIFNEVVAGCRTLEDFENRNYSKKNQYDFCNFSKIQLNQQNKPRQHFGVELSGNPIMSMAPITELATNGGLPTSSTIYSPQSEEYYTQSANNRYYDKIFGDHKTFDNIMQKNSRTPNMPVPKVHPMPYHPQMNKGNHYQQLQQYTQPPPVYNAYQPPPQMHYNAQPRMAYQVAYQAVPQFVHMPVQMAPVVMQDNVYAGTSYRQVYIPPAYSAKRYGSESRSRYVKAKNEVHDQKNTNGYENANTSSSSSSVTAHIARSTVSEEEGTSSKSEEVAIEDSSKFEHQEPSTSVDVVGYVEKSMAETDVQSELANGALMNGTVDQHLQGSVASSKRNPTSSDVFGNVSSGSRNNSEDNKPSTSESTTIASDSNASDEALANTDTDPSIAESTHQLTFPPITTDFVSAKTALVVDTSDQGTAPVVQAAYKTVAEVVQQGLSTDSQSAKQVSGIGHTRISPAEKSSGANATYSHRTTTKEHASHGNSNGDCYRRHMISPRKPSLSYAQMLYPKSEPFSSSSSSSSSSVLLLASPSDKNSRQLKEPTDWHKVTNKKAADPAILSPPIQTQRSPQSPLTDFTLPQDNSDEEDDDVASDDPDAEKRRQKRRLKRQKLKQTNRQQKAQEKELARKESLARAGSIMKESNDSEQNSKLDTKSITDETTVKDSPSTEETVIPEKPKPAFDRENIAARRKKRQELQKQSEQANKRVKPTPIVIPAEEVPFVSLSPYGFSGKTRNRPQNYTIISPDGKSSIPLFIPDQDGLRTNYDDDKAGSTLVEKMIDSTLSDKKPIAVPVQLVRHNNSGTVPVDITEIDENANMVEKLLMFDSLKKLDELDLSEVERGSIVKGLEDMKKMYLRVEKAGQLISYKTGSSMVTECVEAKLLYLTIKLLSNRVELSEQDEMMVLEIGSKVAHCSTSFNYTNYLTALLNFAPARAETLPAGTDLRTNYEQSVVLTKVFLRRTSILFDKVSKIYDFSQLPQDIV